MATSSVASAAAPAWRPRALLAGLVVGGAAGAACLWAFDPVRAGFFPKCLLHQLTGLHCPGCGTARALHALVHGRVGDAVRHNVLTVACLPFLALAFVRFARAAVGGVPVVRRQVRPALMWGLVWLVVAFGVLRNVPLAPFTWLAPPAPARAVTPARVGP